MGIVTATLIGRECSQRIRRASRLAARPGRSQDLYEQSFADGVDFLKGIPPHNGACPAAVHIIACDYLPLMTHTTWELRLTGSLKYSPGNRGKAQLKAPYDLLLLVLVTQLHMQNTLHNHFIAGVYYLDKTYVRSLY